MFTLLKDHWLLCSKSTVGWQCGNMEPVRCCHLEQVRESGGWIRVIVGEVVGSDQVQEIFKEPQ